MIFVRLLLISAVILSASTTFSAHAAKRVALVIGNSGYENVTRLPNPADYATAITAILKEAGFVVDTRRDLKTADMRRALRDFADMSATPTSPSSTTRATAWKLTGQTI